MSVTAIPVPLDCKDGFNEARTGEWREEAGEATARRPACSPGGGQLPPTTVDVLRRVLDREEAARSASTATRAVTNPARGLHTAVERYLDNLAVAPTTADAQPAGPAPLPWLPPLPACRDDTWRTYLSARAEQIAELADEIARRSTANSSPGTIVNRRDPTLLGHLDVWEAVHAGGQKTTP